jgi:hypothetical protein
MKSTKIFGMIICFILFLLPEAYSKICQDNIMFDVVSSNLSAGHIIVSVFDLNYECYRLSCWSGYTMATIHVPDDIVIIGNFTHKLYKDEINSQPWMIGGYKSGIEYSLNVVLSNITDECEKTLVLNLTEPQEQKKAKTQISEDLEEQISSEPDLTESDNTRGSSSSGTAQTPKPSRSDVFVLAKNQGELVDNGKNEDSNKIYFFTGITLVLLLFVIFLIIFFIRRRKKMNPSIVQYNFEN